jgi:hypothetical protein
MIDMGKAANSRDGAMRFMLQPNCDVGVTQDGELIFLEQKTLKE